jgi:hypothetical protein
VGRAGAATRRTLGDNEGQQGTTNVEVSSGFAALDVGSEIPGLRFHTAEPTGFCQSYTIIKMTLELPGVLATDRGGRFLPYRYW